jgi:hypothetical protein
MNVNQSRGEKAGILTHHGRCRGTGRLDARVVCQGSRVCGRGRTSWVAQDVGELLEMVGGRRGRLLMAASCRRSRLESTRDRSDLARELGDDGWWW